MKLLLLYCEQERGYHNPGTASDQTLLRVARVETRAIVGGDNEQLHSPRDVQISSRFSSGSENLDENARSLIENCLALDS